MLSHKRVVRSQSCDQLQQGPAHKRQEREDEQGNPDVTLPLLPALPGESQAAFFRRLGARLQRGIFSAAHTFDRDGIYIYKRPVRSGEGTDKAVLLASGGTVFHHVVVYLKDGGQLTALEYTPGNDMDITQDMAADSEPGPVLLLPAPLPEPDCLPMLHVAVPHHPLSAEHVRKALDFAQAGRYHALRSNCIAFADYACRVLTGGAVRGAPLIFDLLVGQVPPVDPPLLGFLSLMQMGWHDVCDGARMLRDFLQHHSSSTLPLPHGAEQLGSLVAPTVDGGEEEAAVQGPVTATADAPLVALLAGFLAPQPVPSPSTASDSRDSDDTLAVETVTLAVETVASTVGSVAIASRGSFVSTCESRKLRSGVKGLELPARRMRTRSDAR